ncbi:hypothetical protein B0H67DRAFT_551184 [Lasiosphaeris hirsuta]|uniref:Uncharacterized protein n=1 Tax=Lasiosphaeris hirsuta TaxID=260670 RepID=A0AA40B0Z7_9PEZI|nr:hypothetical protein B0H67DRAFT_551184 [Lasiosphaeris hirsuta]
MAQSLTKEELRKLLAEAIQKNGKLKEDNDKLEEKTRSTTLSEFLIDCHELIFSQLRVQTDNRQTTRGFIPRPYDKKCPGNLKPWANFIEQQREVAGIVHEAFPPSLQDSVFWAKAFSAGLGRQIYERPIGDEKTLEHILHFSVEDPVREVLKHFKEQATDHIIHRHFGIGGAIIFENHPFALSNLSDEVAADDGGGGGGSDDDDDDDSEYRAMIYICEYEPPHKLTAAHLRLGLQPMHIPSEVVSRKLPANADPDTKFQYYADLFTASALSQTYHYMIEGGLEYGLLITGVAIVFLRIDWQDPATLYYHLAGRGAEVAAHTNQAAMCTAVGQYLAFTRPGAHYIRGHGPAPVPDPPQGSHTYTSRLQQADTAGSVSRSSNKGRNGHDSHPMSHATFLHLLRDQLSMSLDDGITPLGHSGAWGVLFRVTLLGFGYTFVAKGTVSAFVRDLEHEADVYARLQPLQGVTVPVFLGAIDLRLIDQIYYYDYRVYIIHMTFLSWAGFVVHCRAALRRAAAAAGDHSQATKPLAIKTNV